MASSSSVPLPKPYFFYGHRKQSQNRPVVRGSTFTNRNTTQRKTRRKIPIIPTSFTDWDAAKTRTQIITQPPISVPAAYAKLSHLARHIVDVIRRNKQRWSPDVIAELKKLRRISSPLLTEVLRSRPTLPPQIATRLFHWANKQKGFRPSFAAFNALAYALNDARRHAEADQLPDLMVALGKQPSEKQMEILVRMHADAGRPIRLFQLYRKMRIKFSVRPRVYLYNRILDALVRNGRLDLALAVYDDLREDGVKEEAITFTVLAKGFCREGRMEELMELLGRMRDEVCRPDVFAYTAMIKALVAVGNVDGCLQVWEEMEKDGVKGDGMAYSTMVAGMCKAGKVEKGMDLFREMKAKGLLIDRAIYGALVEGFVAEGKVGGGLKLLQEMVSDGYRADLGIYNTLIGGLSGVGRVDKAYKLFQVLLQVELVPEFETVSPLLASYADKDDMEKLFQLVEELNKLGLPVLDHLSHFFTFFTEKGKKELKALKVFQELKRKGHFSIKIYNILIECFCKIKESKQALLLFEEIKCSTHTEPDSDTYNLIIPCFVEEVNILEACLCYNSIKEKHWTPSVAAYTSLVQGLCKIGEITKAVELVKDCLGNVSRGPMEFKYALTIVNQCRSKCPDKVVEVLNEMMEQDYPLEDIIYCSIIYGFCKYASSTEARKVLGVMKDRGVLSEAGFFTYEDILNEHLKKETAGLILSNLKFFGLESKLKLMNCSD